MSIWRRGAPRTERRDVSTLDDLARLIVGQGEGSARVNGSNIEVAQQSVAVRSAVDLIASVGSELPVHVYQGEGPTRRRLDLPPTLADPAGDGSGLQDWMYQCYYSWLYRGNLYGNVLASDARGQQKILRQVDIFHPDRVSVRVEDGAAKWSVNGKDYTGRMLHRRVNPVPGQVQGLSPISAHANSIALSIATTRFGKGFFDADANPTGILRNNLAGIDRDQGRKVKDVFMEALRGSREPIVMGRGWEFTQLTVNPEESQFLGTMGYSSAECCRIFGPGIAETLGYETGDSKTYANVQDSDIQLLKYALNKWFRRMERLLTEFLPASQYVLINRDALLETNTLARYQAYSLALQGEKWKTQDEVRELENLGPMPEEETEPEPAIGPEPVDDDQPEEEQE